ncbi:hypothetical protein BZM27_32620 [Paraburkholderia steynii]|uniref:Uncharacterized protein n=1 Tax=Paraburkholderia steynii TaxID=1245441 RepID=A0A4R0X5Y0_9BURK|nr:hypothetical protein BZM27_32620 [Paraburkholderia steynii]
MRRRLAERPASDGWAPDRCAGWARRVFARRLRCCFEPSVGQFARGCAVAQTVDVAVGAVR